MESETDFLKASLLGRLSRVLAVLVLQRARPKLEDAVFRMPATKARLDVARGILKQALFELELGQDWEPVLTKQIEPGSLLLDLQPLGDWSSKISVPMLEHLLETTTYAGLRS